MKMEIACHRFILGFSEQRQDLIQIQIVLIDWQEECSSFRARMQTQQFIFLIIPLKNV